MKKFSILAVGFALLFLMELGYSLAIQRYEVPGSKSAFFQGPIAASFEEIFEKDGAHAWKAAYRPTDPRARPQPDPSLRPVAGRVDPGDGHGIPGASEPLRSR